jgi:hypothetical protein
MVPIITCDPDGDLRLKVGAQSHPEEQLEFVVCSKTLSRASRPFKKMLYGNFRESMKATTTSSEWVVELPEDDPVGLKVLLHIIHSEYELVPPTVDIIQLYRILVVSGKYGMSHVVRPWVDDWSRPIIEDFDFVRKPQSDVMIGIAWELGADAVFEKLVTDMCFECEVNSEGQLLDSRDKPFPLQDDVFLGPPDLFGT